MMEVKCDSKKRRSRQKKNIVVWLLVVQCLALCAEQYAAVSSSGTVLASHCPPAGVTISARVQIGISGSEETNMWNHDSNINWCVSSNRLKKLDRPRNWY